MPVILFILALLAPMKPRTSFRHSHATRVAPKPARAKVRRFRNNEHSQFPCKRSEFALVARPERDERIDLAEHLAAMELDLVDDEATYQHLLDVERGRWEFPLLTLNRAEAAWLGRGVEYGPHVEHHALHGDGTDLLRERVRVTQHVDPEVRAKQVTREIMGTSEVFVPEDDDEMLPDEVTFAHAWDLHDYMGF